mmetsp:Transcript_25798/g.78390  ORF Transcript_25798/g.78390 Transcript_25798/m.78390 type:complete len:91 (-) Transcript_25798:17-289(-)
MLPLAIHALPSFPPAPPLCSLPPLAAYGRCLRSLRWVRLVRQHSGTLSASATAALHRHALRTDARCWAEMLRGPAIDCGAGSPCCGLSAR